MPPAPEGLQRADGEMAAFWLMTAALLCVFLERQGKDFAKNRLCSDTLTIFCL